MRRFVPLILLALTACAVPQPMPTRAPTVPELGIARQVTAQVLENETCLANYNLRATPYRDRLMERSAKQLNPGSSHLYYYTWGFPGGPADCGSISMTFRDAGEKGLASASGATNYFAIMSGLMRQTVEENLLPNGRMKSDGSVQEMYEATAFKFAEMMTAMHEPPEWELSPPRIKAR